MQEVRDKGYAFDDEEFEEGLRCLAAPARDYTGAVVASLGIAGPAARFEPARRPELIKLLKDAAEAVSTGPRVQGVNPPVGGAGQRGGREWTLTGCKAPDAGSAARCRARGHGDTEPGTRGER